MLNKLEQLKKEIIDNLDKVKDGQVLRGLEIKYLGRKGELTKILRELVNLSEAEKKNIGKLANEIKAELAAKFEQVRRALAEQDQTEKFLDVTLPGEKIKQGHVHPITIVQNELEDLFSFLGFMVLDGPELESDYFNFAALNIPQYHPARDMQDTFYVLSPSASGAIPQDRGTAHAKENAAGGQYNLLMRTQTSPMQIRAMLKYGAPLRCIVPGRCFRSEATDVRHEHTFYQVEGLMVDRDISVSNMKAVLEAVAKKLYGQNTQLRLRPKYYPFVEPGTNGEVTCSLCQGQGCRLCKYTGWLEIFGSGLVHPNVLRAGGVDPDEYSGFAFGFGLNRLVMLKYGIEDVRLFNSGDMRFLQQF